MYVSAWPGLNPMEVFGRRPSPPKLPFPFTAPQTFHSYVARNLIYHVFRSLNLREDEFVLVPDYHHGNEVRAIRAAGSSIRFYPIRKNLQPDLGALRRLSGDGARVLFSIHYLGWPQPVDELRDLCREKGMLLFEDCALSLLSERSGQPLGSFGDYAVFCLYKTLPIPNGGLLVRNDTAPLVVFPEFRNCSFLSLAGRSSELVLEWARPRADRIGARLADLKRAVGQGLTSLGLRRRPVGDIGFALSEVNTAMSAISNRLLNRFDYGWIRRRRRQNFQQLLERLSDRTTLLLDRLPDGVCPLFFPLVVSDKPRVGKLLRDRGIETVEFWNSGDPEAVGNPEVAWLRRHVLEIPIHQNVTPGQIDYAAEEILKHRDFRVM